MTDLTEKWEKGELSDRWYYIKNESGDIHPSEYIKECIGINDFVIFGFLNEVAEIIEVIDKVPSYEEYLSLTYAKEEDEKIIAEYEAENTKLKELLKECREHLKYIVICPQNKKIVENINQALGEDK